MTLVTILILFASLTLLAYLSKRRFGVLGLALCAGLVLSQQITRDTSNFLRATDVPVEPLAYQSAASIILSLLPSLVLLIAGPQYLSKRSRIIGAVGYGLFGSLLLIGPLVSGLPSLDPALQPTLTAIAMNTSWLLATGIIVAVFDMFSASSPKKFSKKH